MSHADADTRVALPQVTLVAVTSVNLPATIKALEASMAQIAFGACKLLSDVCPIRLPAGVEHVQISRLTSAVAYTDFMLRELADHVETPHCLVIQWDGHVLDSSQWRPEFLEYDYIGATWPQFGDGRNVGNGGFSLRSRRLIDACRARGFDHFHPEDLAIGRRNRPWLEAQGMRFAPSALAERFSAERAGDPASSFGYHGVWHMPGLLGREAFWRIYRGLDERTSIRRDFGALMRQLVRGKGGTRRALRLLADQVWSVKAL